MTREEAIDQLKELQKCLPKHMATRCAFSQIIDKDIEAITEGIKALQYMIYVEDDRR